MEAEGLVGGIDILDKRIRLPDSPLIQRMHILERHGIFLGRIGEAQDDDELAVIGFGLHPSRGLKKGVVVNIESTVNSIQRAVEEAELMAGCEINSVFTGIAGSHVRSLNSHGIVAIRDREVVKGDVERVIDAARA